MRPGNVTVVLPSRPWDGRGKLQLAREIRAAVTPAELSDDDDVVQNRVRREAALPELDDELVQLLDGNLLQLPVRELLVKARQYGVVLAVGVGLLQCVDLIEVTPDRGGQPHGFRLRGVRGRLVTLEDADLRRCEFRQLDVLRLQRLGNGAACGQTKSFSPFA